MKQNQFTFSEKNIETPYLFIKKNIMTWNNTMIQLSNISLLTAADINLLPFPFLAVLLVLGGFVLFESSVAWPFYFLYWLAYGFTFGTKKMRSVRRVQF